MKLKFIKEGNKTFLIRFSKCWGEGSIKLHIILNDDTGEPHTHPWDFKSLILFGGYREWRYTDKITQVKTYGWLSINRKEANEKHLVRLRKLFGVRIPAITIGYYGEKKQLCSLCQELGYCKSQKNKKNG